MSNSAKMTASMKSSDMGLAGNLLAVAVTLAAGLEWRTDYLQGS